MSSMTRLRFKSLEEKSFHLSMKSFSVIQSEENRRIVMLGETSFEGLTMLTNKGEGAKFRPQHGKSNGSSKSQGKKGLWCFCYKKPKHTQETCFKLHGKEVVLQKLGNFKNLPSRNQAYLSNKQEEVIEKAEFVARAELNQTKC